MTTTVVVNQHGQVTLPVKTRKAVWLTPGSQVDITFVDGRWILTKHEDLDLDGFYDKLWALWVVSDTQNTKRTLSDAIHSWAQDVAMERFLKSS